MSTRLLGRPQVLALLGDLGVVLPQDTKLTDEELKRRYNLALDSAQALPIVLPDPPLDVTLLKTWRGRQESDFGDRLWRIGPNEVLSLEMNMGDPMDAFMVLRYITCVLGEKEFKRIVVRNKNPEDKSAIAMRLTDLRMFPDGTPILLLYYYHHVPATIDERTSPIAKWCGTPVPPQRLHAPVNTQLLLLHMLKRNSPRLSRTYTPAREPNESEFKLSFLLPAGPLPNKDLASLAQSNGCEVCGAVSSKRCGECHAVWYCTTEHSKSDWPSHKRRCKSLKHATWLDFSTSTPTFGVGGGFVGEMNHLGEPVTILPAPDAPNIHGNKPFIVRIAPGNNPQGEFCYDVHDRTVSFLVYFLKRGNEDGFKELARIFSKAGQTTTGVGALTRKVIYCWAKWKEGKRLAVAVDLLPDQTKCWHF